MIDVEVVGPDSGDTCKWPEIFARFFEALITKSVSTIVKFVLVGYRTQLSVKAPDLSCGTVLYLGNIERKVKVSKMTRSMTSRKARR